MKPGNDDGGNCSDCSSSYDSSSSIRRKRLRRNVKSVRFGPLTIDEFPIVLGESVVPGSGAPIALGERPFHRIRIDLDRFENAVRSDRRRKFELRLDEEERASMLLAEGYSIQEVSDATWEALQSRVGRMQSAKEHIISKQHSSISKALTTTTRAIKKVMFGASLIGAVRNQSVASTA